MLEVGSGVIRKSHRLQDMFLSFLVCSVTTLWNSRSQTQQCDSRSSKSSSSTSHPAICRSASTKDSATNPRSARANNSFSACLAPALSPESRIESWIADRAGGTKTQRQLDASFAVKKCKEQTCLPLFRRIME